MRRLRWPCVLLCLAGLAHAQMPDVHASAGQQQGIDDDVVRSVLLMLRVPQPHYRPDMVYGSGYAAAGRTARRTLARSLADAQGLVVREQWPMPALGIDCFVLAARDAATAARATQALARDPRVESVQPMQLFQALSSDPLAPVQPVTRRWHLDQLHRHATGRGVRVAVIDSGVALDHPDLRGQVIAARNFVDAGGVVAEAHGTQVAGVVAARAGNGVGMAGVAPDARLLALRACWQRGGAVASCSSFTLARALQFAIDARPEVVNLSVGGPPDALLGRLLDVAMRRGMVIVAAARHASDFPASHPGVLAVSSAEAPVAGTWQAPGRGIPATAPGGGWTMVEGASFAAAEVSGLVADLRQRATRLSPGQLQAALGDAQARPREIDACAALGRVGDGACVCNCPTTSATMAGPHR